MKTGPELMAIAVKAKREREEAAQQKRKQEEEQTLHREVAEAAIVLERFANASLSCAQLGLRECRVCAVPKNDYELFDMNAVTCLMSRLKGTTKRVADALLQKQLALSLQYDRNGRKDPDTLEYESNPTLTLIATW